ncbi:60 kDa SS-A/Ro ribonucleoprotein-like [Xenia sp. Carnegie-2017]|uniref:60 kDa SS-A/Ro ribonucleoprotein-like n=1 Tax=Xenia sp. Carnegie-2017 TaxID=2897299 RepID=UPI001F0372BF|nr:60 kDa SS-A/Ro ribonucleoprotein-like [Xenia sp. Carnegie-2017]
MEEVKGVPQSEKVNSHGRSSIQDENRVEDFVWKVDDMKRLRRFLVLGSETPTYYIDERKLGLENVRALSNLLEAGRGFEVVNEIEKYSIEGRTPRQQAIVFSLAVCARKGDLATKRQAYKALTKICRTSTHLFMFIEFCKMLSQSGKGWGRAHRNGVKRWYFELESKKLAMDITKYQKREGRSHRDVQKLMHFKPEGNDVPDELFVIMMYIALGWKKLNAYFSPQDETTPRRSIGENGNAILEFFKAVEEVKTLQEETRVVELINQHNLVREHIPTHFLNSKEVWRALAHKMPMTAMLRNLGKMTKIGLLDEHLALNQICEKLCDHQLLEKARIHPFNVLVTLKTYMDGHGDKGKLTWNPNEAIVDALEKAFYLSFKLVEPTNKRYMLALNVGESMSYTGCAGTPCLTPRVAAAAMSMVTARTESKHQFVAFSHKIVPLMISSDLTLNEVLQLMKLTEMGGTDCAQPMLYAIENNLEVDVFVIYTDSETKAGCIHPSKALKNYRDHSGIQAKLIVVAMTSNGVTIADPEDSGMLDIVGFDSAVPQVIREFVLD